VRAKKSLGQNFLRSAHAARALVEAAGINQNDIVLEVGPGKGMITHILLEKAKKVVAVEKDEKLADFLKEKFKEEIANKKLAVLSGDILTFNPKSSTLNANRYKLIGSIPYYITGHFLRKFLSTDLQPKTIALIIQKEVAERIVAKKEKPLDSARGKESILSISVKVYGMPRYIKTISASHFSPKPKVNSAIIVIENISKKFFNNISEERFFKLLKAGFAHKRKLLIKNIKQFKKIKEIESVFKHCKIPLKARAEDLSLKEWRALFIMAHKRP